jgi:hypothetical protein
VAKHAVYHGLDCACLNKERPRPASTIPSTNGYLPMQFPRSAVFARAYVPRTACVYVPCFEILHLQLEPNAALHKNVWTILTLLHVIYQERWLLQDFWW